jgi:hypothetical protein
VKPHDAQWRSRALDERTDRLARRRFTFQPPRDTYVWARLRADIALRDAVRAFVREFVPAVIRTNELLSEHARRTTAAMERFSEAMRKR